MNQQRNPGKVNDQRATQSTRDQKQSNRGRITGGVGGIDRNSKHRN